MIVPVIEITLVHTEMLGLFWPYKWIALEFSNEADSCSQIVKCKSSNSLN